LFTQAASAPEPHTSGMSVVQTQLFMRQTKPVPMQSGVAVQAMPEPPPALAPDDPPVAVAPDAPALPAEELPALEEPPLGGAGVLVPAPSSVDEQARGK
jgi:hypothetical protein